ncbi:MAG TPA: GldG family protein [Planctomycetota bacterium]|nr:GldG family protein [Planctomycetota bacterium]
MATNKSARDTIVLIAVVVAFMVTVMANLLADRKFARWDLTSETKYSLSPSFIKILGRLDDTTTLTYYVSASVPSWFNATKRDILDKLREIETAAKGKIILDVVDPSENKELTEKLTQEGFAHDVQDINKDQFSVQRLFTGIKITYKNKPKVSIPAIGGPEQIEYTVGSKLMELTLEKKPIIAVQAPAAPPQMNPMMRQQQGSGYEWLQQGMWEGAKEKFEVKSVDLTENNTVPPDAALLILIRPKELNERQRYEVTRYLAGGGKVFLITSPFRLQHEFGWRAEKTPTGLEDYLKELGISFNQEFVADHSNLQMPKSVNFMTGEVEMARFPFYIKILAGNIDQESILTRFMPGLIMPMPAEITLDEAAAKKNNLATKVLARTSKQSWTVPFNENFNPERELKYDVEKQTFTGQKNVFVQLEGQFPFPFEGKPVPEWKKDPAAPPAPDAKDAKKEAETAKVDKKPGILVVCSSPEAFHSLYLTNRNIGQQMQANASLMVNITETFSLGDDLVKLRSKRYETRSIKNLAGKENDAKRTAIKVGLIVGVPILVALFALGRTIARRAAQNRFERNYAQTIGPSSFSA